MLNKTSKSLFSRHYLTHRLPEHPEWREETAVCPPGQLSKPGATNARTLKTAVDHQMVSIGYRLF
jgi:hypothetical protein